MYVGTAYRSNIHEYSSNSFLALVLLNREFSVLIFVRQCLFVLFAIVLSVILRFTDSEYPFGILILFFVVSKDVPVMIRA